MRRPALLALLLPLLTALLAPLAAAAPAQGRGQAAGAGRPAGGPVCTFIPPLRYPPAMTAGRAQLTGTVLVRVEVDAEGRVATSEPLHSDLPELFVVEALRAARQGRFLPAPGQGRGERRSLILLMRFAGSNAAASAAAAPGPAETSAAPAAAPPAAAALPPAAAPPPAPAAPAGKGKLRVLDAGFGRGVENRRLLGRAEVFAEGDKVYFWMEVDGARVGQVLRHVWIYRGREMQEIELTLKAERWATWSYKTFFPDQRGAWLLELRDEADDLLGSWSCYCE